MVAKWPTLNSPNVYTQEFFSHKHCKWQGAEGHDEHLLDVLAVVVLAFKLDMEQVVGHEVVSQMPEIAGKGSDKPMGDHEKGGGNGNGSCSSSQRDVETGEEWHMG